MMEKDYSYFYSLGIQFQPLFLVRKEFLYILALISLKLNHLTHLGVVHDGAIASCHIPVSLCREWHFVT
jgi:hypothetical protein